MRKLCKEKSFNPGVINFYFAADEKNEAKKSVEEKSAKKRKKTIES